jgi:DNA-binding CsgD family transcriptional regulator
MIDVLLCVLEEARIPFAIVNANAEILTTNGLFQGWSRDRQHSLGADLQKDEQRALIQALAIAQASRKTRFLTLEGAENQVVLQVFPLRDPQGNSHLPALGGVVVRGLGQGLTLDAPSLMALFGLTQREAGIAVAVARGTSVAEIARKNGVIPGTIRVQLKAVFRKMEVKSQLELAAKLNV